MNQYYLTIKIHDVKYYASSNGKWTTNVNDAHKFTCRSDALAAGKLSRSQCWNIQKVEWTKEIEAPWMKPTTVDCTQKLLHPWRPFKDVSFRRRLEDLEHDVGKTASDVNKRLVELERYVQKIREAYAGARLSSAAQRAMNNEEAITTLNERHGEVVQLINRLEKQQRDAECHSLVRYQALDKRIKEVEQFTQGVGCDNEMHVSMRRYELNRSEVQERLDELTGEILALKTMLRRI